MSTVTPTRSLVEKYYELIDTGRLAEAALLMTDGVKFTFANADPIVGRSAAESSIQFVLDQCSKIKHSIVTFFEFAREDGWTDIIFEIRIKFDLKNGRTLDLPGCAVATVNSDGSFTEQRLYADLNEVFAP